MYHEYSFEQLRSYCRSSIESLELWARQLIHEKMSEKYGEDFIHCVKDGAPIIKKEIVAHVEKMQKKESGRCKRIVDTLYIDEIVYFLCHPRFYGLLFKEALDYIYPQGKDEARNYLKKLIAIRNPLSHSNSISMHQVEQAICYSHDFVEGLKEYYKSKGKEKVWNIPRIIRIRDSLGNVFETEESVLHVRIADAGVELKCGDTYSLEVEVDSAFEESDYTIEWKCFSNDNRYENQKHVSLKINEKDVSLSTYIECTLISKKNWHKYRFYDDRLTVSYRIFPPE